VICGTSAGAINAAALATHADDFRRGVARLLRWWRRIDVADVYRADFATLSRHGVRFLAAMTGVGRAPPNAASMLDNAPLARLLTRAADVDQIAAHIASGRSRRSASTRRATTRGRRSRSSKARRRIRDGSARAVAASRQRSRSRT
jgi:NTE family protein